MNFPPEWKQKTKTNKNQTNKRHKISENTYKITNTTGIEDTCSSILTTIQNNLNTSTFINDLEQMKIDSIINTIPYQQIVNNIFEDQIQNNVEIPIITKAYEEMYMRESANANERQCVNGNMCECMFIDPSNQFVAVEFLLPHEQPTENIMPCVLCQRQITQKLFFDIMYDGKNFNLPIQKYGNIFNEVGEYARDVMLCCPSNGPIHCMPLPIVSHQRNRYTVHNVHGIRRLKQHNVAVEDYKQVHPPL